MTDVLPAVFIVVIGALLVVLAVQVGAGRRARATGAHDAELKALADRAVAAQEATERHLAGIDARLDRVERILKDAE
jgi:hypothetical protein